MMRGGNTGVVSAPWDVLCFGGGDWWYHNRGHFDMQVMRVYARQAPVLYVNSIVARKATIREGRQLIRCMVRKAGSIGRGLKRVENGFHVYSPVALPLHHVRGAKRGNYWLLRRQVEWAATRLGVQRPLVWVTCPTACDVAVGLSQSALVYQRTDRFEEFPNVDVEMIRRLDRRLKGSADLTVFVSRLLYDEEGPACRRALLVEHGVDVEHFAPKSGDDGVPEEMRGVRRPIAGFFGGIAAHTFDVDLMEAVVKRLASWSFVLVGKVSTDVSRLAAQPNVRLLGQRPYGQVPMYGRCFDVCLMPWRQNRWIEACNPIKLKEYLALGKPVVSTPFWELRQYDGLVYRAAGAEAFAKAIELALAEDSPQKALVRREAVRGKSWRATAESVLSALRGGAQ